MCVRLRQLEETSFRVVSLSYEVYCAPKLGAKCDSGREVPPFSIVKKLKCTEETVRVYCVFQHWKRG